MTRILHVIRGLTNSSGTTHIVGPLAEAQTKLGHSVSIRFVDKPPFPSTIPDPNLVDTKSFPVTMLRGHPGVSIPFARAIEAEIRSFDIVHVHAVWNFPSFYAMRAADRAGVPFMVAPQGSLEPWALAAGSPIRRAYAAGVEGPLIRRATHMQALTANEAQQFRQFGYKGPISIISNGVSEDWLTLERGSLARDFGLPSGARTLLFLSRVHPKKGLDILLRAFSVISPQAPDAWLIVAGSDAGSGYLAEMKRLSGELNIEQRCRFVGEVSGQQKRRTLGGADIFALISHSEGVPIAVLEALAAGLPVIITSGCNLAEVAEIGAGLVIPPTTEAAVSALKAFLIDADDLAARGSAARRLAAERFTWPLVARKTVEAYATMIESRRS